MNLRDIFAELIDYITLGYRWARAQVAIHGWWRVLIPVLLVFFFLVVGPRRIANKAGEYLEALGRELYAAGRSAASGSERAAYAIGGAVVNLLAFMVFIIRQILALPFLLLGAFLLMLTIAIYYPGLVFAWPFVLGILSLIFLAIARWIRGWGRWAGVALGIASAILIGAFLWIFFGHVISYFTPAPLKAEVQQQIDGVASELGRDDRLGEIEVRSTLLNQAGQTIILPNTNAPKVLEVGSFVQFVNEPTAEELKKTLVQVRVPDDNNQLTPQSPTGLIPSINVSKSDKERYQASLRRQPAAPTPQQQAQAQPATLYPPRFVSRVPQVALNPEKFFPINSLYEPVVLYWVNYQGEEEALGEIAPRQRNYAMTRSGHDVFVARNRDRTYVKYILYPEAGEEKII